MIPESEVARRLNVGEDTIRRWRNVECRPLGRGARLPCEVIDGERHYYPRDTQKIEDVPVLRAGRVQVDGKWYRPLGAASAGLKRGESDLLRWRHRDCPWLGRRIDHRKELVREEGMHRFRRLWLYNEQDLEAIRVAKLRAVPGKPACLAEDAWPSTAEVIEQGFSLGRLKRAKKEGSLRRRRGVRVGPDGQPTKVTEWHPADLSKLRERHEAGRKPGYIPDAEAALAPYAFAATTLGRWRGDGCPYLGRLLDSHKHRVTGVWCNSEDDLREIRSRLSKLAPGPLHEHHDAEGTWLPTGLVTERYGISEQALNNIRKRDERNRKTRCDAGRAGRPQAAPSIRSKVIDRPHPKIPNGRVRVWHLEDIERYRAWRQQGRPACGPEAAAPAARSAASDNGRRVDDGPIAGDLERIANRTVYNVRVEEISPAVALQLKGEPAGTPTLPKSARKRPLRPRWDAATRTLFYGGEVCKVFRQAEGNQERILAAFEEDGWPKRIDDPLPGDKTFDPGQRLRNAVRNLNTSQDNKRIHFAADGRQGILWEPASPK
jgi:hypothetical protein